MKSKIIIPQLNKKIFPYSFYLTHWIDCNSTAVWETLEEIKRNKPCVCLSAGWLVSIENNSHTFVSDVSFEPDGSLGDCGSSTTIPSDNIIKLTKIRITK